MYRSFWRFFSHCCCLWDAVWMRVYAWFESASGGFVHSVGSSPCRMADERLHHLACKSVAFRCYDVAPYGLLMVQAARASNRA